MENGSYAFTEDSTGRKVCRLPRFWVPAEVVPDGVVPDVVPDGTAPTTSTSRGRTANDSPWGIAVAGMVIVKLTECPDDSFGPSAIRALLEPSCCCPLVSAHWETASRVISGWFPMNARTTGEVIETWAELWTDPEMVTEALGSATVGVSLVRVTVAESATFGTVAMDEAVAMDEVVAMDEAVTAQTLGRDATAGSTKRAIRAEEATSRNTCL
jgi:hypothetical protein